MRTVELGSFTAVANELNSSQPTVSRQIATLEDHLGCLLFQRTTRTLTLTDDGRTFYELAQRTLETAAEAEASVGKRKGKPTGKLRIVTSVMFARLHIITRLARFHVRYPGVEIDLLMNDGFSDLVGEGIDLEVRFGDPRGSNLIARRIGSSRIVVVASPSYLATAGTPQTPFDLQHHNCLIYNGISDGASWPFLINGEAIKVPVTGWLNFTSGAGLREGVLQGLGIAALPAWHFVDNDLTTGKLKLLFEQFETKPLPISVLYPSRRYLPVKVRAMIDFLSKEFEIDPHLSLYGET